MSWRLHQHAGAVVHRLSADIDNALLALYDSQGIMVVDAQAPGAKAAIERGLAFLPLAAIAPTTAELSQDIYRLNYCVKRIRVGASYFGA